MEDDPVYMIGIAAKLAGIHPQTLRIYERRRLICPKRSTGSTRLYSNNDIERLKLIQQLTQEMGMNLAGVEKFFELTKELDTARASIERLGREIDRAHSELEELVRKAARPHELVLIPKGEVVLRRMIQSVLED